MSCAKPSSHVEKSCTVLVVLAHYKHNESIHSFLRHISTLKLPIHWQLEVIVSDNSDDFEYIPYLDINLTIYHPGENKHYFGGCWYALTKWQEDNGDFPDWIIVANHDLIFENDFFIKLLSTTIDEDIGVIAPDVRIPNGIQQNPHKTRRPSLLSMVMRVMAFRYRLIYSLMNLQYIIKMNFKSLIPKFSLERFSGVCKVSQRSCVPIYSAHGSILLFRKVFFDRGGNLVSKAMMYHEEFLVAERCRRMGLRIMMNNNLKVIHNENTTIRLVPKDIQYGWMKCLSHVLLDIYRTGEKHSWASGSGQTGQVPK